MEGATPRSFLPGLTATKSSSDGIGIYNPLMSSLAMPRKSVKTATIRRSELVVAADGTAIPSDKLPALRLNDDEEVFRAVGAEADEVKALAPDVSETGVSSTRLEGVNKMRERRKLRHDEAIKKFEDFQRRYYSDCEDRVLKVGRALRSELHDVDARIDTVLNEIMDGEKSVHRDKDWLYEKRNAVKALVVERRNRVEVFSSGLESVEIDRSRVIGERLQALSAVLIDVGYELQPDIERLVHGLAMELNAVVLANKREHAEVTLKLLTADVIARDQVEARWATTEVFWRKLKHEKCVNDFLAYLQSPETINPTPRQIAFRGVTEERIHLNEHMRVPLVRELLHLRPPELTNDAVQRVRRQLDAVNVDEEVLLRNRMESMQALHQQHVQGMQDKLELLRRTLHSYEALAPEGGLAQLASRLSGLMSKPEYVDKLSVMPSVKLELDQITAAATADNTIYDAHLQALTNRVTLLSQATQLHAVLVAGGKGSERGALVSLVESLRSAKKTDIPAILVKLHKLVASLARVPDVPAVVVQELDAVCDALEDAVEEIHDAMVAAGMEVPLVVLKFLFPDKYAPDTATSQRSDAKSAVGKPVKSSAVITKARVPSASSKGPRDASPTAGGGDVASVASHQSKARRSIARSHSSRVSQRSDGMSTAFGHVLPFPVIRGVQRRLGIVAAASDLPAEVQETLRALERGCKLQETANQMVDGVLAGASQKELALRASEGETLLAEVKHAYDKQLLRVRESTERICSYMQEIAFALRVHAAEETKCDEWGSEELAGLLDHYEETKAELERRFAEAKQDVMRAEDLLALEQHFANALSVLEGIKDLYREHADSSIRKSNRHAELVAAALRRHRKLLCNIFALRFPQAEEVDGVVNDGDAEIAAWKIDVDDGSSAIASVAPTILLQASGSLTSNTSVLSSARGRPADVIVPGSTLADLISAYASSASNGASLDIPGGTLPSSGSNNITPSLTFLEAVPVVSVAGYLADPESSLFDYKRSVAAEKRQKRIAQLREDIPALMEREKETRELAAVKVAAAQQKKGKKAAEEKEAEDATNAAAEAASALQHAQTALQELEAEDAQPAGDVSPPYPIPSDPNGSVCVDHVFLDASMLNELLTSLRYHLLTQFQQYCTERRHITAELCAARVQSFTVELEERLRNHWPREGDLEVSVRSPRAQQLAVHKERMDRFERNLREQLAAFQRRMQADITQSSGHLQESRATVDSLLRELERSATLATVQGIQVRARQQHAAFNEKVADIVRTLSSTVQSTHQRLNVLCEEQRKLCVGFSAGGDYADVEIQMIHERIDSGKASVAEAITAERAAIDELQARLQGASVWFEDLYREIDATAHRLSVRDGLGSKYGEPRRIAQEALRTATSQSESDAADIDKRLQQLEALLHGDVSVLSREDELAIVRNSRGVHNVTAAPAATAEKQADKADKGKATSTPATKTPAPAAAKGKAGAAKQQAEAPPPTPDAATDAAAVAAEAARKAAEDEALLDEQGPAPLSVKIRYIMTCLRDLMFARAIHIEAFKEVPDLQGPLRSFSLPFVSTTDLVPLKQLSVLFDVKAAESVVVNEHTLKGASPGNALNEGSAKPRFMELVVKALDQCKQNTLQMFAAEKLAATEDDLPASLKEFLSREKGKADDNLEYSRRRFREQVTRCQALCDNAGEVLVNDVKSRALQDFSSQTSSTTSGIRTYLNATEAKRTGHVEKLKVSLGDVNAAAVLQSLHSSELERIASDAEFYKSTQKAEAQRLQESLATAQARLVTNATMLLLVTEELVVLEDLRPLPGDELVVAKRPSFKRLHKAVRKSGVSSLAAIAAGALGDVSAVELDEFGEAKVDIESTKESEAANITNNNKGKAAPANKAPAAATKGKGPETPAPVTTDATSGPTATALRRVFERKDVDGVTIPGLGEVGRLKTTASTCCRHTIRARDQAIEALQVELTEQFNKIAAGLDAAVKDCAAWQAIWSSRVASLTSSHAAPRTHSRSPNEHSSITDGKDATEKR